MDRRALFFLVGGIVCFVLVPVADTQFRHFTAGVGIAYMVLALASWLDARSQG
jgi:hypothetical protein